MGPATKSSIRKSSITARSHCAAFSVCMNYNTALCDEAPCRFAADNSEAFFKRWAKDAGEVVLQAQIFCCGDPVRIYKPSAIPPKLKHLHLAFSKVLSRLLKLKISGLEGATVSAGAATRTARKTECTSGRTRCRQAHVTDLQSCNNLFHIFVARRSKH